MVFVCWECRFRFVFRRNFFVPFKRCIRRLSYAPFNIRSHVRRDMRSQLIIPLKFIRDNTNELEHWSRWIWKKSAIIALITDIDLDTNHKNYLPTFLVLKFQRCRYNLELNESIVITLPPLGESKIWNTDVVNLEFVQGAFCTLISAVLVILL